MSGANTNNKDIMKLLARLMIVLVLLPIGVQTAFAQFDLTVLPGTTINIDACTDLLLKHELSGDVPTSNDTADAKISSELKKNGVTAEDCEASAGASECQGYHQAKKDKDDAKATGESKDMSSLLACAIKTGRVSLSMIPHFVSRIANFLLALIGIVAVLFIVLGGYWYIYGGLADQKEKGKKTIINALWGVGLATVSWVLINMIIAAITS